MAGADGLVVCVTIIPCRCKGISIDKMLDAAGHFLMTPATDYLDEQGKPHVSSGICKHCGQVVMEMGVRPREFGRMAAA